MLELLFLHIPKTGGSSLYEMAKAVYGPDGARWYSRKMYLEAVESGCDFCDMLGDDVKSLHGHFHFHELKKTIEIHKPKIVTFFRDPVQRVISNYKWWNYGVTKNPDHAVRDRMDETFEVYITRSETQNKITRFFGDCRFEDLFFWGFLESFNDDVAELAKRLGWPEMDGIHEKNSAEYRKVPLEIDERTLKRVRRLNRRDYKIYNKAKRLKEEL